MSKKGRLPARKVERIARRSVERSAPSGKAIVATESPVMMFDEIRGFDVAQILLMSGCEFRGGRNQMPIVDSHDDSTVRNIMGSVRNMEITASGELVGDPSFASDPDAQAIATRYAEGHITDFSVSADILDGVFIPAGQAYTLDSGEVVYGPAEIITRWMPFNASICATGADVKATVMRSKNNIIERMKMDEALLAKLATMGLPEGMTEPNEIMAWMIGKITPVEDAPIDASEPVENMMYEEEKPAERAEETEPVNAEEIANAAVARALKADADRRKQIQATCKLAKIERAFADQLCDDGVSIDVARKRIIERMANKELGQTVDRVEFKESEVDKFNDAIRDGMVMRSHKNAGVKAVAFASGKPAVGAEDFSRMSFPRIAESVCRRLGMNTDRMSGPDIAKAAMGSQRILRAHRVERSAWHTTGNFPNLLLDAANKTLLAAYEETPYTWSMWARQAASVSDFKNINRMRFSESPDPEAIAERQKYPEKEMSDSKESYNVQKYGAMFSVSWETIVNDDLDAISRVPAMHGNACRRKQNKVVYEVLTGNPLMGDGVALFASGHGNFANASAAPSKTTLDAVFLAMMTQKGLNSDVIINVQPKTIIVPAAISGSVMELLTSVAPPSAGGSAVGNSGVTNIYGPNGGRRLQLVVEPQLDAYSASAWFVAADSAQIDTVEIAFLEGEESPVLDSEEDFDTDTYKYKVRQTFAAKAIDWRGLYKYHNA